MNPGELESWLRNLPTTWQTPDVVYFPIRHHSPACATFVRRWIREHRPVSVLVEGPASFTSMIPFLLHSELECPVAIYTYFLDKQKRMGEDPDHRARMAAFYPLCDYSPEMVALREGHLLGARLRFIDLEYAETSLIRHAAATAPNDTGPELLANDPHLAHSEYLAKLASRFGCRDFNDWWDHVFESAVDQPIEEFVNRLLTYCALARKEYTEAALAEDATTAREACMAAAIRAEIQSNRKEGRTGPILVVTGGFHTVALPSLVAAGVPRPASPKFVDDEVQSYLIRYSFDQLDALSGYASGMPSPAFYDRFWHADSTDTGRQGVVADWIVEIVQKTREQTAVNPLSTADAIAAMENTRRLAMLRGHAWPLREDMLDGIRSAFVKGEIEVEGRLLMALIRRELAGIRIGKTPKGAAVPPIVDDFRQEARRLRLPIEKVETREMSLDLYRNANHRQISRLFHRLDLLKAPFASFLSGPDFVNGSGLERMQEVWRVCWSPSTESSLISAATRGPTVEDAALHQLIEMIGKLEEEGKGRCSASAVEFLVRACRLGLHDRVEFLIPLIDRHMAEDPAFASVTQAISQLDLLQNAREPLEAMNLAELPRLLRLGFHRSCKLLDDLCGCPDDAVEGNLSGLQILRDVVGSASTPANQLDRSLFHDGLKQVVDFPFEKSQPVLAGAAAGILYAEGQLDEEALMRKVAGYLGSSGASRKTAGILRGLFATAREIAWQMKALLEAVDQLFGHWDQEAFLAALPDLRLAFSDLTPREIVQVADRIADLHGQESLGNLVMTDVSESELLLGLHLSKSVREILLRDGLAEGTR